MAHSSRVTSRMETNRIKFMKTGYRLFVKRTIDGVSLEEVAKASKIGVATLYRYFGSKTDLVVEIFVWKWKKYVDVYIQKHEAVPGMTAVQKFAAYLDVFMELYRDNKDFLRFNQFFNVYMQRAKTKQNQTAPFLALTDEFADYFKKIWEQGEKEGTLRTDIPWQKVFLSTMHILLATATRYAIGLMYQLEEGTDPEEELIMLRNMLYEKYVKE